MAPIDFTLADLPRPDETLRFDGVIMTREEIRGLMLADMLRYYPLAALTLLIVLGLLLRSLSAALAAAAAVTLAVLWTLGFMAFADIPINLISTSAGILIGVAGVGDAVHYVSRFRASLASGLAAVRGAGLVLALVMALAAAVAVASVVRLGLHARRDELEIMQLVGSPIAFIRGPFVAEGVLQGGLGALIAPVR